jgi:hypothetical protein
MNGKEPYSWERPKWFVAAGILLSAAYYFRLKTSYDAHVFLLPAIGALQAIHNISMAYRLAFGKSMKMLWLAANGILISGFAVQFATRIFDFNTVIYALLLTLALNVCIILLRPAAKS